MDHIRDWVFWPKSTVLCESELNYVKMYFRLSNWNDISVYKNEKGEIIPEYENAMICIHSWFKQKEKEEAEKGSSNKRKTSIDIGD